MDDDNAIPLKKYSHLPPYSPDSHLYSPEPNEESELFQSGRSHSLTSPVSRWIDGFRRNPHARITQVLVDSAGRPLEDQPPAEPVLALKLKNRHLQMIGFGGAIGTGLFIASGSSLAGGGPASLLIAYSLIGIMLYCTVHALGEMATMFPVAGSFAIFASRFLDPAWGFAMGWNYTLQWLVTLPLEIIAASLTLSFWPSAASVNPAAWVAIFLVAIVAINFFGVRGYGEAEFVFSTIKVTAVIGFILLGIVLDIGGGEGGSYLGAHYWHDPGAFNNGFKGLCSVFVTAAFAFSGTELVGLAAAETANPRKSIPTAVKQIFWRVTIFYITSLFLVGLLVPYTNSRLLSATNSADTKASPFVIAIELAGIRVLPSVFNVVILISVLSVGNTSVYATSRILAAMADRKQAPSILGYIDRRGRPLVAITVASAFGLLCFLAALGNDLRNDVLNWLIAISGLSSIITWGTICLCHIRFRSAWRLQGHSLAELPFRSAAGVTGSYVGLTFNILILIAQFWTGFSPVDSDQLTASQRINMFFQAYLAAPICLVMFAGWKIIRRTKIKRRKDMDLVSGKREEADLAQILAWERTEQKRWPKWKKLYRMFC